MASESTDIRNIILQAYVLDILRGLKTPKRFGELNKIVKTKRTLTTKLSKLRAYGLIEIAPVMVNNRYTNSYRLSKKGHKLIEVLEKIPM